MAFDSHRKHQREADLKLKLAQVRSEYHTDTAQVLEDIAFASPSYLKQLYNHTLNAIREKAELVSDAEQEHKWHQANPTSFELVM